MREFVFWAWLMGGTPLALALIQWTLEWIFEAIHARFVARHSARDSRRPGDSALSWTHV